MKPKAIYFTDSDARTTMIRTDLVSHVVYPVERSDDEFSYTAIYFTTGEVYYSKLAIEEIRAMLAWDTKDFLDVPLWKSSVPATTVQRCVTVMSVASVVVWPVWAVLRL